MLSYIVRRLLLIVPTLLGVTLVVFFVIALSPGGIGASLVSAESGLRPQERQAIKEYFRKRYDLDKPKIVQYMNWLNQVSPIGRKETGHGYPGSWHLGLKSPDLGESFSTHRPVMMLIRESLPITMLFELLSLPLVYGISIWTGIVSARARGKFADVGIGTLLLALYSMPEIWIGVLMIGFLTNSNYPHLHWFPSNGLHGEMADTMSFLPDISGWRFNFHGGFVKWIQVDFKPGWVLDMAWHMALPLICLSYGNFAFLSRLQRGALLENLAQDFVRTARAKGLSERIVVYRHAFRNSLMPLITVSASILPGLISGSVIVESIFGVQGMGKLFIDSVNSRDLETMMAIILLATLLQVIGNLLADLAYAVADPRVSYVD